MKIETEDCKHTVTVNTTKRRLNSFDDNIKSYPYDDELYLIKKELIKKTKIRLFELLMNLGLENGV